MVDGTNIRVSETVWRHLNSQKRPGESFDDVLRRELGLEREPTERDWRAVLETWLDREDVPENRRDDVVALAELLRDEGRLGYTFAVDERGVVTEWEWQESKDYLAASPVAARDDQRTWRWVGVDE